MSARILIIGGYGAFGALAAVRLAREADLEIIVAGRDPVRAELAAHDLAGTARARVRGLAFDATAPDHALLARERPAVVLNASGPFQAQDYTLADAAIRAGAHYVDIADARGFVVGIPALDADARRQGVTVVAGASTVPAWTSAVVDHLAARIGTIDEIAFGISPGNSYDPGLATTRSVLAMVGAPMPTVLAGRPTVVAGWQGTHRHGFPGVGRRWFGYCDVPELQLFPRRYPGLRNVRPSAGVEVAPFHWALMALAWLRRRGLVRNPESLAVPLLAMKRGLSFLGSDVGVMYVAVAGSGTDGPAGLLWHLVARSGHGPYIPTTPAVILARRLARGEPMEPGARPGIGLLTLDELTAEVADLDIASGIVD